MDLEELEKIAAREIKTYRLRGWTFVLTRAKRRLGACNFDAKRIEIAEYYARNNPPESVLDTLRHEIAHALAGYDAGHGPVWRTFAVLVGAAPRACEEPGRSNLQPGDWQATCPACGKTFHFYRRPSSLGGYSCKCPARSPLTFAYTGDPARKPDVPLTVEDAARWEAVCSDCGTVHLRVRRPRPGTWHCKCPRRGELTWRPRAR